MDYKEIMENILDGSNIRKELNEGYFSNLILDLDDEAKKKMRDLQIEDPLFNDVNHRSYKKNKENFDEFIDKLEKSGVNTQQLIQKITSGKRDIRWTEVWNGLMKALIK